MSKRHQLFPDIQPFRTWWLKTSAVHEVCVYEAGTPRGQPVLYIHGGPGGGIHPSHYRYFDPQHFHVVLVDQRGCGQSRPLGRIEENTTWDLINDFEDIRRKLGTAYTVHQALPQSTLVEVPDACRSSLEPGIVHELIKASQWLVTLQRKW